MEGNLTQPAGTSEARNGHKGRPSACSTKLIPDVPLDEDSIDDENPHRRLAGAIADLMRNDDGGISVGLEGSWGAGKTSVVSLLRKELKETGEVVEPGKPGREDAEKQFALINFDAWAHEGDPLRRSFLETLIPHLWKIGWVRKAEWEKRLDIISQRLEEKTISNSPQVGVWGIAFGLALILAAVGSSFLSASAKDIRPFFDTSLPVDRKFVAGLFLVFSPALVVSLAFLTQIGHRGWRTFTTSRRGSKAAAPDSGPAEGAEGRASDEGGPRSVWAMLFNKGVTSERTRTFKTQNPTSIEFEREFRNLMEEALEGNLALDISDEGNASRVGRSFPHKIWRKVSGLLGVELRAGADRPGEEQLKRRRVVLILDNLDRVEASDALSIWSTLQTFLGRPGAHHDKWFKQLWVIVLYDPRGIRLLWDKFDEKGAQRGGSQAEGITKTSVVDDAAGKAGSPLHGDSPETKEAAAGVNADRKESTPVPETAVTAIAPAGAAAGIAAEGGLTQMPDTIVPGVASTSFMDKSFQIRFEVPPPVLSDWRLSLLSFLEKAFPDNDHWKEFDDVQTVLEYHLAETGEEPTFRELKLFVNQIGSLHRQWAHCCTPAAEEGQQGEKRFPLTAIAFYVLQRRRGVDVVGRLLEGRLIGDNYKELLGNNPTETLAALAYNVGRAKAGQLILEKPIEDALLLGADGADRLVALERIHSEGFWEKLRIALNPNRRSQDAPTRKSARWVGNAAQALLKSSILDPAEKNRHSLSRSVVRQLCKSAAAGEITAWPAFDSGKAEAIAALLRWKRELGTGDVGEPTLEEIILRSASASIAPNEKKSTSESVTDWLENLLVLRREIEQSRPPGFDERAQISSILEPIAAEFRPVSDGVHRQVESAKLSLHEEALFLMSRNNRSESEQIAASSVRRALVKEGHIHHHLGMKAGHEGINEATMPAIVRCMWMIIVVDISLPEPPDIGAARRGHIYLHDIISAPDESVAVAFAALLEARDDLRLLLDGRDLLSKFVATCLKYVLSESSRALKLFNPYEVVNSWPIVYRLINGDRPPLHPDLKQLIKIQPPEEMVREISKKSSESGTAVDEDCWLYVAAITSEGLSSRLDDQAATWQDELWNVGKDQWVEEIDSWGGRLELLFVLREAGRTREVPAGYKEAVIEGARAVLGEERQTILPIERRPTILLDRSADEKVFDQIYKLAVEADGDISETFFNLYGDALADPSKLSEDGFGKIFYPLLQKRNVARLRWMRAVLEKNLSLLDNDAGWSFKQKVEEVLRAYAGEKEKDEVYKELLELAESIGAVNTKNIYSVWLLNAGANRSTVSQILLDNNFHSDTIPGLIQNVPSVIREHIDREAANRLARILTVAGAEVEVRPLSSIPE